MAIGSPAMCLGYLLTILNSGNERLEAWPSQWICQGSQTSATNYTTRSNCPLFFPPLPPFALHVPIQRGPRPLGLPSFSVALRLSERLSWLQAKPRHTRSLEQRTGSELSDFQESQAQHSRKGTGDKAWRGPQRHCWIPAHSLRLAQSYQFSLSPRLAVCPSSLASSIHSFQSGCLPQRWLVPLRQTGWQHRKGPWNPEYFPLHHWAGLRAVRVELWGETCTHSWGTSFHQVPVPRDTGNKELCDLVGL